MYPFSLHCLSMGFDVLSIVAASPEEYHCTGPGLNRWRVAPVEEASLICWMGRIRFLEISLNALNVSVFNIFLRTLPVLVSCPASQPPLLPRTRSTSHYYTCLLRSL